MGPLGISLVGQVEMPMHRLQGHSEDQVGKRVGSSTGSDTE